MLYLRVTGPTETSGRHPEERNDEGSQPVMACANLYWVRSFAALRMTTRLGGYGGSVAALCAGASVTRLAWPETPPSKRESSSVLIRFLAVIQSEAKDPSSI
jgi:hypothetical protein